MRFFFMNPGGSVLERDYQTYIVRKLKHHFPGCFVLKNDSEYIQGIPDLLVLCGRSWAMLEIKVSEDSPARPNQAYYIQHLDLSLIHI
jgi:hypothetical protein